MTINRRTFLSHTSLLGSSFMLPHIHMDEFPQASFHVPAGFSIRYMATNWGFQGSWEAFCAKARSSGYDGIEVWVPPTAAEREQIMEAVDKHRLSYGFLAAGADSGFDKHLAQFQQSLEEALAFKPLFINCHSGRDYFTFEQNKQIIAHGIAQSKASGIPVYHETHRSRMLYAAHVARAFLEQMPELQLTLDISHWCNVHESLLQDQPEAVALALKRAGHVHARVGHAEGPQVTDPRAPEWKQEVDVHFSWWDEIVQLKAAKGETLTVTTEFGPPNYMPIVPFTRQPLADLWDVNAYMMQAWKERYTS